MLDTKSNKMEIQILSSQEAVLKGYLSLTIPYSKSYDVDMEYMKNTIRDLKGCDIVVIDTGKGYEVARHKREMILSEARR